MKFGWEHKGNKKQRLRWMCFLANKFNGEREREREVISKYTAK